MGKKGRSRPKQSGTRVLPQVPLWLAVLGGAAAASWYGYSAWLEAAAAAEAELLDAPWDPQDGVSFDASSAITTVLWTNESSAKEGPTFPATLILVPSEVSKVTKTTVDPAGLPRDCGWSEFFTAYDRNGDVLLISIDDFFVPAVAGHLRRKALASEWAPADIHPDNKDKDDIYKGNGFPGLRVDTAPRDSRRVTECTRPVLALVDPAFDLDAAHTIQTMYGLVDKELQPGRVWLDSQRMPHNDVRWDLGVHRDAAQTVPASYASVYGMTTKFDRSGTGLFLEKESGHSLLKTLPMNERAQGNFNPHVEARLHPHLHIRKEVPDPHPHSLKYQADNAWVKTICVAYVRYNRFTLYDGRRLHSQALEPEDYPRLSSDPATGRLTLNSFFWQTAQA